MFNDTSVFWEGAKSFHRQTKRFARQVPHVYFEILPPRFHVQPIFGIGKTTSEMEAVTEPLLVELKTKGVPYDTSTKESSTFYDLYVDLFGDEPVGSRGVLPWCFHPRWEVIECGTKLREKRMGFLLGKCGWFGLDLGIWLRAAARYCKLEDAPLVFLLGTSRKLTVQHDEQRATCQFFSKAPWALEPSIPYLSCLQVARSDIVIPWLAFPS